MQFLVQPSLLSFILHTSIANKTMTNSLVQLLLFERRRNAKTGLSEGSSEKSALAVTENVHLTEEADEMATVEDVVESDPIGFVLHVETTILHSEQNAIAVGNQSKETLQNVAAHSETIVEEEVVMIEEVVTIEDLEIKNNIIEMIGFVLHVRMTISLSEPNVTNVESLDLEETLVEEIPVVAVTETIVEDAEATEEVATAADETVVVEDVEATEEVATVADETVIVVDVKVDEEMIETVVEEMTVQTNSIERLVESDLATHTIDHLKKSSLVDINDVITMTTKVKT